VLAGGRSSRFAGVPKGLELVGGTRIIDRVSAALRGVSPELILVANDPAADAWLPGARVVADQRHDAGGLAGLESALSLERDVVIVAWDMPFVTAALLRTILETARRTDADAVVPPSDSPFGVEPFCAFYAARARGALQLFLGAGRRAAHDFVASLARVHILDPHTPDLLPHSLMSVNTADDLTRARAIAERPQ